MGTIRWQSLWLSASPLHAVIETLLVSVALLFLPLAFIAPLPHSLFPQITSVVNIILLDGPICALWCAVRLRLYRGPWWLGMVMDSVIGATLGLIPTSMIVVAFELVSRAHGLSAVVTARLHDFPIVGFATLALVAFGVEFVVFRLGVRLWLYWDRLRRTRLRWALTHAHLMIVVLGAGLLGALLLTIRSSSSRFDASIVPVLFFLAAFTVLALLIVLVPSALFSYLFARPTTRRLEALAAATTALRDGNYGIRVPVAGEDEVAQLQTNFNAMAADLERAVRELKAERDTVTRLLHARRELVASVSHELRTPVATLRSYLESTNTHWEGVPPTTLRHDLQVMEHETIHLQALIDDLFTLSRAEVGKLDMRCELTDVEALARRVVQTMAPLAWQSGKVDVVVEAPALVPPALVDAHRVDQVLQNILHNGIRHTPPGGIVAVALAAEPEAVVLRVQDTGDGIAAAELPHIWDRFYRTERSRGEHGSGTGLGLALVKELTEAMGGTVEVDSVLGQGSCFTVRLPRALGRTDPEADSGGGGKPTLADATNSLDRSGRQLVDARDARQHGL
jgi:signal transduction histidine kinase